jgi:mRNA-degrading endonuclease toxin of MazEF toxin-antitoxin module
MPVNDEPEPSASVVQVFLTGLRPRAGGVGHPDRPVLVLSLPRWADVVICLLVPEPQDRRAALAEDLVRLGRLAGKLRPQP